MLYIHGSVASRMLRALADGIQVCVTVTLVDGLVLARSAFHHSMNYRSVVVFGTAYAVEVINYVVCPLGLSNCPSGRIGRLTPGRKWLKPIDNFHKPRIAAKRRPGGVELELPVIGPARRLGQIS